MSNNFPILSIIIPAYNGAQFLELAIHSLASQRVIEQNLYQLFEIILIDDGSTDHTYQLASKIARKINAQTIPNFMRVYKKQNGQYGSVINYGLKKANGKYFKVLDCDDTFNTSSFIKLIYQIYGLNKSPDIIYTDHIFEKIGLNKQVLISLRKHFVPYRILKVIDHKFPHDIITMHAIIYRTDFLRKINYHQLEHVYYSDSIYALIPLLKAKTFYYSAVPLYRYYIGRDEQSINIKIMVKNIAHQQAVLVYLLQNVDFNQITSKSIEKYVTIALRRLAQWQTLLIFSDKKIKNKRTRIFALFAQIKLLQPKYHQKILRGLFIQTIKITRGYLLGHVFKIGIRVYAYFKKNIMADWD